jgi:lysophospholipase L1-like esterase
VKVKLLLMDGGGIDILSGGNATNVANTFKQFLTKVKSDGTVQAIVYYIPTTANVADTLTPTMSPACASSPVPCYFLDLRPLFSGHPDYIGGDNIHPSSAGGTVIANAVWKIIQTKHLLNLSGSAHGKKKATKGKAKKANKGHVKRK